MKEKMYVNINNDVKVATYIPWFAYFNEQYEKEQHTTAKRRLRRTLFLFALIALFVI